MVWYYDQFGKGTAPGPGKSAWDNSRNPEYEFFEETDPTAISNLNSAANLSGGPLWGPFNSLADAQAQAQKTPPVSNATQYIDQTRPGIPVLSQVSDIVGTGISATGAGLNLLDALTQASTWLRIGEVALGLILIAIGVAHLTNAVPAATKAAASVAKIGKVFA